MISDNSQAVTSNYANNEPLPFLKNILSNGETNIPKLPLYIQNMLAINGYDNVIIFANITEDHLLHVEEFARNDLLDIVAANPGDKAKYYGLFQNTPEKFQFLAGIKSAIFSIRDICKSHVASTTKTEQFQNELHGASNEKVSRKASNKGSVESSIKETPVNDAMSILHEESLKMTDIPKSYVPTQQSEELELLTSSSDSEDMPTKKRQKMNESATPGTSHDVPALHYSRNVKIQSTKWSHIKYSRTERARRKRENLKNQTMITSYFSYVDEVTKILNKNENLKRMLSENVNNFIPPCSNTTSSQLNDDNVQNFLKMCNVSASQNQNRTVNKYGYDYSLKQFATYIFLIGGRLLYETLSSNMKGVIPSIATISRHLQKTNEEICISEGAFRFAELKTFLAVRNLPPKIWVSEDATKITGRIEYCSKSNKIVGFLLPYQNGLPDTEAFIANSASRIEQYFNNGVKCNYAYVIMAQSLSDKAPSFCLSIVGTDNRFTHETVLHRWQIMIEMAKNEGIEILGFSSDGDTRLMKAMRVSTIPSKPNSMPKENEAWKDRKWFHHKIDCRPVYIQDTVHEGTKLRNRLTKDNIQLRMGNFIATSDHLKTLINCVSKDKHLLSVSDINPEDRMNFRSVEKITSECVRKQLQFVKNSDATCVYLLITDHVLKAFLEKDLKLSQRIYSIWLAIFFFRLWKSWLLKNKKAIGKHFITSNCYEGIELNGHSLIVLARLFRDDATLQSNMFVPWLFSSQPCEQVFRSTRSMTTTFSTVVNYSLLDIMNRLNRIQSIQNIINTLQDTINFPREKSSRLGTSSARSSVTNRNYATENFENLSDIQLDEIVEHAFEDAKSMANKLGMLSIEENCNDCVVDVKILQKYSQQDDDEADDGDEIDIDDNIIHDSEELAGDSLHLRHINGLEDDCGSISDSSDQLSEQAVSGGELNLKDFTAELAKKNQTVTSEGLFVRVTLSNGKMITAKKKTLVWFFDKNVKRISSDRLIRVRENRSQRS